MGLSISIKSEIDSRVVLYPMMRCIQPLGSCLIITSNKQVTRLIDLEEEGDFRNFHILYDPMGATDDLLDQAQLDPYDFNYVIYDNVGVIEQDKLIIPLGPIVSEEFEQEMLILGEDRNTHILRFGKSVSKKNTSDKKDKSVKNNKLEKDDLSDEDVANAARNKFIAKKEDVHVKLKKLPNLMFPKFEDIELLESNKQFFNIDRNFIKFFYTVFQEFIGIKEPNYVREVTKKDASSSSISRKPTDGENSIIIDAD